MRLNYIEKLSMLLEGNIEKPDGENLQYIALQTNFTTVKKVK